MVFGTAPRVAHRWLRRRVPGTVSMDLPEAIAPPPAEAGPAPDIHGLTDGAGRDRIFGWAMDGARPGHRLKVELRLGETLLGTTTADIPRQDLTDNQIGDGCHGFEIAVPAALMLRSTEFRVVTIAATGQEVPIAVRLRRVNVRPAAGVGRPEGRAAGRADAPGPEHRRLREEVATLAKRLDALPDAKTLREALSQHGGRVDQLHGLAQSFEQRLAALADTDRLDQLAVQQGLLAERLSALETWLARMDQRLMEPAIPVESSVGKPGRMDLWQKLLFVALGATLALALGVSLMLRSG